MSVVRSLSAIYLAAASTYVVAIAFAQHPALGVATQAGARYAGEKSAVALVAINHSVVEPGWVLMKNEARLAYEAVTAPKTAGSERVAQSTPAKALHSAPKAEVTIDIAPPAPPKEANPAPTPAQLALVRQRLRESLTPQLYDNFELFLFISKAEKGPLAQRMYVFAKEKPGGLKLRYDWLVSTGREKVEYNSAGWKLPTFTPAGYYELDPHRMYRRYRSIQWGRKMPYAMFFNWVHDGNRTGLAIHASDGADLALLGKRASGGCIHLSPEDARVLYHLIRTEYKGLVPRFAYDRKTATMSNDGLLMHKANGRLRLVRGYKVLVVIQDFNGENVVATIM